jgi:Phosphotransferase enzyme family
MEVSVLRKFVRPTDLSSLVSDVFGTDRRLVDLRRIDVATKKGVYRMMLDDATEAILYVWHPDENYWPDRTRADDQYGDPCGLDAYVTCKARYDEAGARTADSIAIDSSRRHYPADLAVVEYLPNGTLDDLIARDPTAAQPALAELAGFLRGMSRVHHHQHGRVASIASGAANQEQPPHELVLAQAVRDLDEAAAVVPALAEVSVQIKDRLHERVSAVLPRADYSLVHGELGPDHVMLDRSGRPVIVDLEGTQFVDIESEHVFCRMRFGAFYDALRIDGLDDARMTLYELAMHLSLVAGPMRMVDGDHPERDFMREIATANTRRILDDLKA